MIKSAQQLIEHPKNNYSHIVLLGAGASRAAFPDGDATGQPLPLMDDLINIVNLRPLIDKANLKIEQKTNFETFYSQLVLQPQHALLAKEIEQRIVTYFSSLSLPKLSTIYDRLLISLRPIDAVFTFNWDPFLFDAYHRNYRTVALPKIFFLHGNVRIGACLKHAKWGARKTQCPVCSKLFTDVPLLYPITQKDYSKNPYIRRAWSAAEALFKSAFTLTIFGYGAPESDKDAVKLLRRAWTKKSDRSFEHIEIIDIACKLDLYERWKGFTPTYHYHVNNSFEQSRIARWPRRSCESLIYPMKKGIPCEEFPLPNTNSIKSLQEYASDIARHEENA